MGYGTIASTYSASSRTTPSFTCGSTNDAYTVLDNTNGNASLKYPIGLITLDEIIAAGAGTTLSNTNADYYMNRGMSYWTMTPYEYNLTAHNAFINENGGIEKADVYTKKGIVPVINLNSNMLTNVTGTGTISDPYVIKPKIIVTFDSNGGSGSYTKSVRVGEPYGEFPNVTRDGYELDGWYTDSIEGEKIESFTLLTKNESHTVYAHWKKISEVKLTLSVLTKNGTVVNSGTPDFTKTATTDEGLYMMTDDDGTSYYFRGAIEDNYVKFGKNSAGKDMWWRIIRINGNGSLRMIYDGTSAHVNGESYINDKVALSSVAWNTSNYNDAKYVGYMYGGTNGKLSTSKEQAQTNETESNIKVQLESWYEQNIDNTSYKEYISDEVFCNDRSTPDHGYALGYEQNQTHYGAYERLITNKTPTFKCDMNDISLTTSLESDNDRFTVGEEKGNGKLKYPVGLITADEIAAAGGVAPVINLKADVAATLKGSGTMTDPYRIS